MSHGPRRTVCLSSQSGCALACTFCATGRMGLGRNLAPEEISEQLLRLARLLRDEQDARVSNVVMMGMGEPFHNYDNVLAAIRTINAPDGFGLGARQIAISTAGWIPGIDKLAEEPLQVKLALSLHAPDDELRSKLMPVTKRYPIAELMEACRRYRERTRRRVFIEYLLLAGVNDSSQQARQLVALLRQGGPGAFHVNLIAYNPTGSEYVAADDASVRRFRGELERGGIGTSVPRLARPRHRRRLRPARDAGHPARASAPAEAPARRAGVGSCDDGRARQHARLGDPPGSPGRAARRDAARDRRDARARAGRGARAGDGGGRELQHRLGGLGKPVSIFRYTGDDFHIGGSDASGIVAAVGPGVTRWKPGDEVVIHCNQSCGECPECNGLDPMACSQQKIWAYETNWGSFADYCTRAGAAAPAEAGAPDLGGGGVVRARLLHRLPHARRPGRPARPATTCSCGAPAAGSARWRSSSAASTARTRSRSSRARTRPISAAAWARTR